MAEAGQIEFDATINTKGYETGASKVKKTNNEIEKSVSDTDKKIEDLGDKGGENAPKIKEAFQKTFDAIGDLAEAAGLKLPKKLAPIAAIGSAIGVVGVTIKNGLQQAMDQINLEGTMRAKLGGVTNAAKEAADAAAEVYRQGWGESLDDVADIAANVSQVIRGIGENDLVTVTQATEMWSDVFDADAGESIRGVNVLMEKFGLNATEATDLMTKGMQNGLNYTDELADNLSEYSGRWAEAGTSASEYFSLLQAGVDSGAYQLDKVGDFLNEFLTSLTDGRMEEGMENFSQGTKDVFDEFTKGRAKAEDVLNAVIGEMSQMTDKTKEAQIASTLWSSLGEDNALGMIEALANVPDSYGNISGATQQAAADNRTLGQDFEELKRTITYLLAKAFTPFVDDFVKGCQSMIEQLESFASSADWSFITNALSTLGVVLGTVFNAAAPLVKAVVDALSSLSQWVSDNSDFVTSALVALGVGFAVFNKVSIVETFTTALTGVVTVLKNVQTAVSTLFLTISANPIGALIALIAALVVGLVYFFTQTDTGKQMWQSFCDTLSNLWQSITDFFQKTWQDITGWFKSAGDNIQAAWNAVTNWFSGIPGKIKGFFSDIGKWFGDKFNDAKNGITNAFNDAVNWVKDIPNRIKNIFSDAGNWLKDAGGNIVKGLWNGINDMFGWVRDNILGFGGKIVSWAKSALGIHSPSRVFADEVGKFIPSGIAVGIDTNMQPLEQALAGVSVQAVDAVKSPVINATSSVASIPSVNASKTGPAQIIIQNMSVRDDTDIRKIAQELHRLQQRDMRKA